MLVRLTLRLIALPEHGWPRLTAACDAHEPLPLPFPHAAGVAALSVLASFVGAALRADATIGLVAAHLLTASAGYFGAAALSVFVVPGLVRAPPLTQHLLPRFGSAAALPLLASGLLSIVPLTGLALLWTLAGAGLAAWSAWVGAADLLGMEGPDRKGAAVSLATVATLPILVSVLVRIAL